MSAFTLRLDDRLARRLDRYCRVRGYKKSGFILALIRKFFEKEEALQGPSSSAAGAGKKRLQNLVGIVSLGGDAIQDTEAYFE